MRRPTWRAEGYDLIPMAERQEGQGMLGANASARYLGARWRLPGGTARGASTERRVPRSSMLAGGRPEAPPEEHLPNAGHRVPQCSPAAARGQPPEESFTERWAPRTSMLAGGRPGAAARGAFTERRAPHTTTLAGSRPGAATRGALLMHRGPAARVQCARTAPRALRWPRRDGTEWCSRAGGERRAELELRSRRSGRSSLTRPMSKTLRSVGCAGAQRASGRGWLCASLQGAALPDCDWLRGLRVKPCS